MVMSRDQNERQNHNTQINKKSFARVQQLKNLETNLTNRNSIHEEIKSRLKSRNACYHSVQNILSSTLLPKNIKIKTHRKIWHSEDRTSWYILIILLAFIIRTYRTIILPVVLYGCEAWLLTLREECRLRVFENRVLRSIFVPKKDEVTGEWRKLCNEEINDLHPSPNIIWVIK